MTDADILEAVEALKKAEAVLANIDRTGILHTIEELRRAVEALPQVQLDMRIARMRLAAKLSSDPDKTPVEHIKGASQMAMKAVDPKKP
jgi:exoribonuclease II